MAFLWEALQLKYYCMEHLESCVQYMKLIPQDVCTQFIIVQVNPRKLSILGGYRE